MKAFPRKMLVLAALLAVGSCFAHAAVADDHGAMAVEVRYADLNLASPQGVQVLKRRISNAAIQVCGADPGLDVRAMSRHRSCVQHASESALAQVGLPSK